MTVKRWCRPVAGRARAAAEDGIATWSIAIIVMAAITGGTALTYVATDGFGTRTDDTPAATTTSPAPTVAPEPTDAEPLEAAPSATAETETPTLPADLPEGFPNIGVPFYSPSVQVAAPESGSDLYVLEYVTDHEMTIVNMFVQDNVVEKNGWHDVSRSVEGQTTATQATSQGYSLVIAVLPERANETKTSIHYTLRRQ